MLEQSRVAWIKATYENILNKAVDETWAEQRTLLSKGQVYRALEELYNKASLANSPELAELTGALVEFYATLSA